MGSFIGQTCLHCLIVSTISSILHTEPFLFWPFLDFYSLLNVVNWKTHVNMWTFTLYRGWQKQTGGLNWCRVDCLPLPLVEYVWGCGIQFQKIHPALTRFFCLLPIPESHFHLELQFLMMFMLKQFHGSTLPKKNKNSWKFFSEKVSEFNQTWHNTSYLSSFLLAMMRLL